MRAKKLWIFMVSKIQRKQALPAIVYWRGDSLNEAYGLYNFTIPTGTIMEALPKISKSICLRLAERSINRALVLDLQRRGLLDDTIVVWGGEFGRTPMGEVRESTGRNHHIDAFTMWFAGGGFKRGFSFGETDEFGFGPIDHSVHVRDIHATLLHQLGLHHERLSIRSQGLDFRLTGVQPAKVVKEVLS